jgi:hypothetical protein
MRYEKPAVISQMVAMNAIQSGNCKVKSIAAQDSTACGGGSGHNTNGAYEADE